MLRDVVVHIQNEQPIMADLLNDPAPSDVALICSNLRTINGKKPIFVDLADSTFVIPLAHVRFIEIHKSSMAAAAAESEALAAEAAQAKSTANAAIEVGYDGYDRGPLARLAWLAGGEVRGDGTPTVESGFLAPGSHGKAPFSDEIDPELLRRIREA